MKYSEFKMRGWGSIFVFGDKEERESFVKEFLENNAEFATDILPDLKEPKKPLIGKPKTICDELVKDLKRSERKQVLDELMRQCEKLELKSLISRAPRALSGGQRLRWSILFEAIMGKKCFLLRDDITIMDKNSADICENWLKNYVEDVRVVRVSQMSEDALPKNTLCYKLSGGEIERYEKPKPVAVEEVPKEEKKEDSNIAKILQMKDKYNGLFSGKK